MSITTVQSGKKDIVKMKTYSVSVTAQLINFLLESSHLLHCKIALKVSLSHAHLHAVSCLQTTHI